jgi:hypothetical protein
MIDITPDEPVPLGHRGRLTSPFKQIAIPDPLERDLTFGNHDFDRRRDVRTHNRDALPNRMPTKHRERIVVATAREPLQIVFKHSHNLGMADLHSPHDADIHAAAPQRTSDDTMIIPYAPEIQPTSSPILSTRHIA